MNDNMKVAVMLADGFEEIEALTVVDILRRSNIKCDMISIKNEIVEGTHDVVIKSDKNIKEINKQEYTMIVLPGGLPGADNLRDCEELINWIREFATDNSKYIAAICAAPQVLAKAGIVDNKRVTSYPADEFRNILSSSNYVDNENVVVDGNIITSRGPATASEFAFKLVELLGKDTENLKRGMLFI